MYLVKKYSNERQMYVTEQDKKMNQISRTSETQFLDSVNNDRYVSPLYTVTVAIVRVTGRLCALFTGHFSPFH